MSHLPALTLAELKLFAAFSIFLTCYFVFAVGKFPGMKIDRPGAAIIGAVLMVAFGIVRPDRALSAIDFKTLVLLFSMMLIVAALHLAGFFEWITQWVVEHLRPRHLLPTVIFLSGLLSAFFVNDIICLAMVPFVLTTTRRMGVKPLPYLLAVATASNIGSVATITGNPQNMIIGSYSGISYFAFLYHLGPVAVAGLFLDWLILAKAFPAAEVTESQAGEFESGAAPAISPLVKPGVVILIVLAGFLAGAPPAMMAAFGAAVMLITRTREPRQVYEQVDWGLLVFFAGLFVIIQGVENAGITDDLLRLARPLDIQSAGVFTIVTATLSNIVSNVPAVMLLKSMVPKFANPHVGWLVLAMASTLAGNLTITGSVANIIVVERSRDVAEIGFGDYFRVGLPVTALTLVVGSVWLWWIK